MLTKDLLRFRVAKGEIKPSFIDPSKEHLGVMGIVNSTRDIKLAKGLNKLILDRCEFSHGGTLDHRSVRNELFTRGAELLKSPQKFSEFSATMTGEFSHYADFLTDIYSDHPENERLVSIKPITVPQLLDRYNVALVQSLLIQSRSVEIRLVEPDTAKLRRLFSYLKFFRLLADIRFNPDRPYRLDLTIAGPGSVLENVNKYGLQLASFFPAIVAMKSWELRAEIQQERGTAHLAIDQESKLVSSFRFSTYEPPEIKVFRSEFGAKCTEWQIIESVNIIPLPDGSVIFPDFQFVHASGTVVSMELFHRWHESPLLARLNQLQSSKVPLLIGVDRSVAKKNVVSEALMSSAYFERFGFQFNDFPAISVVKKLLDSVLESTQ